jgi:predicted dehydrogenase
MPDSKQPLSRRRFMGAAAGAAAVFTIVPRHCIAASGQRPPSEKLNIACIGAGGRGGANINGVRSENIIAFVDVDQRRARDNISKYPDVKVYTDFRRMYDEQEKNIDAVVVSTPDHTHAVAVMGAIRRGKHVYCEKPLAHSVGEIRALMKAARDHKVICQLGNQGHSSESIRTCCEWIQDGAIGQVHTIHAACGTVHSTLDDLHKLQEHHDVPEGLDWDLWLGPAQFRAYNPLYCPGRWRNWMPFGMGTIGDWVCHVVDPVFWALDLGAPLTIQAQGAGYDPKIHGEHTFPKGYTVKFTFPARGRRGPITLYWYSGTNRIPRPEGLDEGRNVPGTGAVVLGTTGGMTYGSHGAGGVRIFPEQQMRDYQQKRPAQSIPRVRGNNHHNDWLDSIRAGTQPGSNFDYGGPLTEIAALGIIGLRMLGQELRWDAASMRFTNNSEANRFVAPAYRKGWTL